MGIQRQLAVAASAGSAGRYTPDLSRSQLLLATARAGSIEAIGNGTYYFIESGTTVGASGGDVGANAPVIIPVDHSYFDIPGRTAKLRLMTTVGANATAAGVGVTFTFGLYPVTVAGGANALTVTLGTVVSGSTAAHINPATSTITESDSAQFNLPAVGAGAVAYAPGVVVSGGPQAADSSLTFLVRLVLEYA